jgi:predicted MFS family arabinose efflux permease
MTRSGNPAQDWQLIAAVMLCMAFGPSVFLLMPVYVGVLQGSMGLVESDLGLLAASDLIGIAAASLLAPLWINRAPWRRLSAACFAGLVTCNLASLVVLEFLPLFVLRLLAGFLTGSVAAIIMGIVAHTRSPDRVAALLVVAQVTFQSVAFLVLPGLIANHGLPAFLLSVVALQLCALAGIAFFPSRPLLAAEVSTDVPVAPDNNHWPALFILAAMAAFFTGQTALWAFIELIGNGFGLNDVEVGYALAMSTFISLLGPLWGAWAGDRYGRLRPVLIGGIAQIVVLLFLDAATSVWAYAAMLTAFQVFWNLGIGYQYGALVAADHSNRFVVIIPAAQCIGIAAGPVIGGIALEGMGNPGVYLVSGTVLALYLLLIVPFLQAREGPGL